MSLIRILIAEEQPFVREKLRQLIASQADMVVIAEAKCLSEVLSQLKDCQPQVLLLDISMPRQKVRALEFITAAAPATKVIVLSLYRDKSYRYDIFKAGAIGLQVKTGPAHELLLAIRMAVQGKYASYSPWLDTTQRPVENIH